MENTIKKIDDNYNTEDDSSGFIIAKPTGVLTLGVKENDEGQKQFKPFNMDYELKDIRFEFNDSTYFKNGSGWLGSIEDNENVKKNTIMTNAIDVSKINNGFLSVEWKETHNNDFSPIDDNENSYVDIYISNIDPDPNQDPQQNDLDIYPYSNYDIENWTYHKTCSFKKHNRRVSEKYNKIPNPFYLPISDLDYTLEDNDKIQYSERGNSISMNDDGTIIAVVSTKPNVNFGGNINILTLRVLRYNGYEWVQFGDDIIDNFSPADEDPAAIISNDGKIVAYIATDNESSSKKLLNIYRFNNSKWEKFGNDINNLQESDNNKFGISISLSGNGKIIAVNSIITPTDNLSKSRSVIQIFKLNDSDDTWMQLGQNIYSEIYDNEITPSNNSCISLNTDGTIIAFGSPGTGLVDGSGFQDINYGSVTILKYNGFIWLEMGQKLNSVNNVYDNTDPPQFINFGHSVSLNSDGTIVAIGSPYYKVDGYETGVVKIFKYNGFEWKQLGMDIYNTSTTLVNLFGWSVSINNTGTIVVVGSPHQSTNASYKYGSIQILKYNNQTWETFDFKDGTHAHESFGHSVSINGDGTIVAGYGKYELNEGVTDNILKIFRLNIKEENNHENNDDDLNNQSKRWYLNKRIRNNPNIANEQFGMHVSMSDDGKRMAIMKQKESLQEQDIAVIIYNYDKDWKIIQEFNNEFNNNAGVTYINLSGDGRTIAIVYKGGGDVVRVYKERNNIWEEYNDGLPSNINLYYGSGLKLNFNGKKIAFICNSNENVNDYGIIKTYSFNNLNNWKMFGDEIEGWKSIIDGFGKSLSFNNDGTRLVVTSGGDYTEDHRDVGIWHYDSEENKWKNKIKIITPNPNNTIPDAVATLSGDGNTLAYKYNNYVYIHHYNTTWNTQHGGDGDSYYFDPDIGYITDISINNDGTVLVVSGGNIGSGSQSSAADYTTVILYTLDSDTVPPRFNNNKRYIFYNNFVFYNTYANMFGWSISINGDGTRIVISAPRSNYILNNSGEVQIFDFIETKIIPKPELQPVKAIMNEHLEGDLYIHSEDLNIPSKWCMLKANKENGSHCRIQASLFSKK